VAKPSSNRTDAESWRAIIPPRPKFGAVVLANEIQREGNTREDQKQIEQGIRRQMKGVFENPRQQQNHSDNYEHRSVQSIPDLALEGPRDAEHSNRTGDAARVRQTAGKILRRAGNISSSVQLYWVRGAKQAIDERYRFYWNQPPQYE